MQPMRARVGDAAAPLHPRPAADGRIGCQAMLEAGLQKPKSVPINDTIVPDSMPASRTAAETFVNAAM
jgi:hypothetical protein